MKLRPITDRYDLYLIITLAVVFVSATIAGLIQHRTGPFYDFLGICGGIAVIGASFILATRR